MDERSNPQATRREGNQWHGLELPEVFLANSSSFLIFEAKVLELRTIMSISVGKWRNCSSSEHFGSAIAIMRERN
jgi:hypothetical protein